MPDAACSWFFLRELCWYGCRIVWSLMDCSNVCGEIDDVSEHSVDRFWEPVQFGVVGVNRQEPGLDRCLLASIVEDHAAGHVPYGVHGKFDQCFRVAQVTELDGTYIAITKTVDDWKINGTDLTQNILTVHGKLYGDISGLINTRTHISQASNGQIWVWTIVSFGSSFFVKSAPLVGQFIGEYLDTKKVAN